MLNILTLHFVHLCISYSKIFLITLYPICLKIKKQLHGLIFRGVGGVEKSKLKLFIYTCTWPKFFSMQLTGKKTNPF